MEEGGWKTAENRSEKGGAKMEEERWMAEEGRWALFSSGVIPGT
jgi:hypothetical protein